MPFSLKLFGLSLFAALTFVPSTSRADITRLESGAPDSLPKAPFDLPRPEPKDSKEDPFDPKEIAKSTAMDLLGASAEIGAEDLTKAIYLRSMAYQRDRTLQGKRELVAWCVQAKDVDSAIYWLQRAALEDHLDEVWTDPLLQPLRQDKRWAQLEPFLKESEKAWKESSYTRTLLVLPAGHKPGTPLPMLLTLHGMGSSPEDFAAGEAFQLLANELQVAVLAVSATNSLGMNSFVWTERFEEDWKHISGALESVKAKVTPKGKLVVMGFSQGGQLAAELAASHPDKFAGAIVLSPGYAAKKHLPEAIVQGGAALATQKFIVAYNDHEHPGTVETGKTMVKLLNEAGATVLNHAFNADAHAAPVAFDEHMSIWLQFILTGNR